MLSISLIRYHQGLASTATRSQIPFNNVSRLSVYCLRILARIPRQKDRNVSRIFYSTIKSPGASNYPVSTNVSSISDISPSRKHEKNFLAERNEIWILAAYKHVRLYTYNLFPVQGSPWISKRNSMLFNICNSLLLPVAKQWFLMPGTLSIETTVKNDMENCVGKHSLSRIYFEIHIHAYGFYGVILSEKREKHIQNEDIITEDL